MKFITVLLTINVLILLACNNAKEQTGSTTATSTDSTDKNVKTGTTSDTTVTGCFTQINKRDTATLQLDAKGITITGPLSYNYYQKDRNGGTLQAEIVGNILIGWYLFRSEGIMSVRQAAWKISKNQLWPAIGEMKEQNDSMLYVNPDKLSYDSAHPFIKVACVL